MNNQHRHILFVSLVIQKCYFAHLQKSRYLWFLMIGAPVVDIVTSIRKYVLCYVYIKNPRVLDS
jgi:hypothetical protein